jgi:capsular exopolysaccharide synthesis family protein
MSFGEITARTNMPIIGELMYADTISPIVLKDGSRSVISEQIRGLRTNLGFYGNNNDQKVILVTSSVPGEGKSFVSTNLAIAYAVTGKKVVLIEADLRKPNITKHFNLTRRMGLGVYLSGGANLEDILFEATEILNLTIIPSGPIPPNPVELILNGKMELLIAELKNLYDYIIIDCPPVGLVTDAFEFSKFVDTALFIVRHRYTPRSSVKNLLNKIFVEKRFKHSAIVMNGIAMGIGKYGYGYDYSYLNYNELGNYNYMYYNDSYGYFQQNSKSNGILRKWKQVLFDPFKAFFGLKK